MMKKTYKICLAVIMIIALLITLTGCSNSKKSDSKYNYKSSELGSEPVTLTIVTKQGSSNGLSALKEAFEAEYSNVTVEIITNYQIAELSNDLASGVMDIYMGSYEYELWNKENLDLWKQYCLDYKTDDIVDLNAFNSDLLASVTTDGHIYTLPLTTGSVGMMVNMDLLKECGINEVPKTTDELLSACAAVKQHGYQPFRCMETSFTYLVEGMTEYEVCKDGKNDDFVGAALAADTRVGDYFGTAANFLYECAQNGYIDTDSEIYIPEAESDGGNKQAMSSYMQECYSFLNGDVAFFPGYSDVLSSLQKRETRSELYASKPFTYEFVPTPTKYGEAPIRMAAYDLYINAKSDNLDWCKKFIQFAFWRDDNTSVGNTQIFADAQYTMSPYDSDTVYTERSEKYYSQFHKLFKDNNSCIANDVGLLNYQGKGIYAGCVKYGFDVLTKENLSVDIMSGAEQSVDAAKQKFVEACRSWFIDGNLY